MTVAAVYEPAVGFGVWNLSAGPLKMMLLDATYTPDLVTHEFVGDLSGQITGTGYTAGGAAVTGLAWAWDGATNNAVLTCTTVQWPGATFSTRYAAVYHTGNDRLLSLVDFETVQSPAGFTFALDFSTNGLLRVTA